MNQQTRYVLPPSLHRHPTLSTASNIYSKYFCPSGKIKLLCEAKLCHFAHLIDSLLANLVRSAPSQLGACNLLGTVACVPDLDLLGDTAALLGSKVTASLGLKLKFITLD
jgi:hypothetical protein